MTGCSSLFFELDPRPVTNVMSQCGKAQPPAMWAAVSCMNDRIMSCAVQGPRVCRFS